jgi:hypothetical protein
LAPLNGQPLARRAARREPVFSAADLIEPTVSSEQILAELRDER